MQTVEKINLTHLKKCDQIWEDMTPTEKGRICAKCKHTLIDFRKLSDKEVAHIHIFTEGKVCGLYTEKQLQVKAPKAKKQKGFKVFYLGLLGMLSATATHAQVEKDSVKMVQTESDYLQTKKEHQASNQPQSTKDSIIISGTLTDESGELIIFANVIIKGTDIGVTSDYDGKYYLNVTPQLDSLKEITLVYSYTGYRLQERIIDSSVIEKKEKRIIDVAFNLDGVEVTEFYIATKAPWHKRFWSKVKRIFKRKK